MKGLMYDFWGWGVVLVATVITTQVQAQNCAPTLSVLEGFSPVIEISGSIGAPLRIRCSVDPAPPTTPVSTYVWQKNGMDIVVPDITLQQFTFPSLQVSDGGRYRCGVQLDTISCSGEMIYSPEITINTPPEISALTGPTTVTEGDTLQLTCTAIGWPPPTIEWFHPNGLLLVTDEVFTNPSFISGDEGNYTCQASNSRGMVTQSVTITVEVPPPVPTSVIPSPTQTMTSPSPTPTATPAPEGESISVVQHTLPPGLQDNNGGCEAPLGNAICQVASFLVDGNRTTFFRVDGDEGNVTIGFGFSISDPPSIARVELSLFTCPSSVTSNISLYSSPRPGPFDFRRDLLALLASVMDIPCSSAQNVTLCVEPPATGDQFYFLEFTNPDIEVAEVQFFNNTLVDITMSNTCVGAPVGCGVAAFIMIASVVAHAAICICRLKWKNQTVRIPGTYDEVRVYDTITEPVGGSRNDSIQMRANEAYSSHLPSVST